MRALWSCFLTLAAKPPRGLASFASGFVIFSALAISVVVRPANAAPLPLDAVVNVRSFGASGNGIDDDTDAILKAVMAASTDSRAKNSPARIVYFPAGTYRVTRTIEARDEAGRYRAFLAIVGESKDSVTIRLGDHAPDFSDPVHPKALIFTSSGLLSSNPTDGGKDYLGLGEGNDAYGNYIENLTVEIGEGNAGAVAADFLANNFGAVRSVNFRAPSGSGRTALSLTRRWPGPLLVSDVRVEGFQTGIEVGREVYSVVLNKISLAGQTTVALRNVGNVVTAHAISIRTAGTAIDNADPKGMLVIDGAKVDCIGAAARPMINYGYLVQKNFVVGAGCRGDDTNRELLTSRATFAGQALPGFGASWALPAVALEFEREAQSPTWVSVADFGVHQDGQDASPGLRRALASGAPYLFFPPGKYLISESLDVPKHVRRIEGLFSTIVVGQRARSFRGDDGMIRVSTAGRPLQISRLAFDHSDRGSQVSVQHSGSRPLLLSDIVSYGALIERKYSGGLMYLENICCGPLRVAGPRPIYAAQLDTEGSGVRIVNDGSPLSVLGLKTEGACTAVESRGRAKTQVVGGLLYRVRPTPGRVAPAFVSSGEAIVHAAYAEAAYLAGSAYMSHFNRENEEGAVTGELCAADLPARGLGRVVPGLRWPGALEQSPPCAP